MAKYIDSKGQSIKTNQILSIYINGKKKGETLVKTYKRKKVLYRIKTDGSLSKDCCYLDEALEKASKILILKKKYKKEIPND